MPHADWRTAKSDAAGRFVLSGLCADLRHLLLIRSWGFGEVSRVVDRDAAREKTLGDIVLRPQASISGLVLGSEGRPARGRYVVARALEPPGEASPCPDRHYSRTDDLGRFRIDGLGAGEYRMRVLGQRPRETIQVLDGEQRRGVKLVVPGLDIAGRVTDVYGVPVPRAGVLILDARTGRAKRQLRTTRMDGRFRFRAVPEGSYTIRVVPNSIHEPQGRRMVHGVDQTRVHAGDLNVCVILPPAELITGTLVGTDGKPLARSIVFARDDTGKLITYEATNAAGEFLLRLPPGTTANLYVGDGAGKALVEGVKAGRRGLRLISRKSAGSR